MSSYLHRDTSRNVSVCVDHSDHLTVHRRCGHTTSHNNTIVDTSKDSNPSQYFLQSISVDQCSLYLLCCIYVSPLGLLGQLGSLHQLVLLCHVACKIVLSSLNMSLFKGGGGRYPGAGTLTLAPALQCQDRYRLEAGGLVTVSPCQALCEAPGPGLPVCAGLLVSSSGAGVTLLSCLRSSRPGVNCPAASAEPSPPPGPHHGLHCGGQN